MLKKGFLILILPLFAFVGIHKFYVSVTSINYSSKEKTLQITSRIFIDDLELLLKERYGVMTYLATKTEVKDSGSYVKKYMNAMFHVVINGKEAAVNYIGREYDNDIIVIYLEVEGVELEELDSIEVENGVLMDMFEEQKNLVHFKFGKKKKSFVLVKENNKGMLKF